MPPGIAPRSWVFAQFIHKLVHSPVNSRPHQGWCDRSAGSAETAISLRAAVPPGFPPLSGSRPNDGQQACELDHVCAQLGAPVTAGPGNRHHAGLQETICNSNLTYCLHGCSRSWLRWTLLQVRRPDPRTMGNAGQGRGASRTGRIQLMNRLSQLVALSVGTVMAATAVTTATVVTMAAAPVGLVRAVRQPAQRG